MRRLGLIALLVGVSALAAASLFLENQAEADLATEAPAPPATDIHSARDAIIEKSTHGRWTVGCRTKANEAVGTKCSATNRIVDQRTGQTLFVWVIGNDTRENLISYFQTPTGVLIGEGLTLIFSDNDRHRIDFHSCDNRRCEAVLPMTEQVTEKIGSFDELSAMIVSTTRYDLVFKIDNQGIVDILQTFKINPPGPAPTQR